MDNLFENDPLDELDEPNQMPLSKKFDFFRKLVKKVKNTNSLVVKIEFTPLSLSGLTKKLTKCFP